MKVSNWRRKLMESLVAGGLLAPTVVSAANLDTNLLLNPGFESVDFGTLGDYGSPKVLNWSGGPGFAYSHNPGVTGIPDYADGTDPPGAGDWYFTSNNNPSLATGDWRAPDQVYQDIDVSAGATGTQIGIGEAAYKLSAYMSSYLNDNDSGNVQLDFKNGVGTTIGSALISDPDFGSNNVWSLSSAVGVVPAGTASIRVSLFGTPRNGGADGYIDNVDVRVKTVASELMILEVNTTNGQAKVKNQTGAPVNIDYYEITSASSALNAATWTSFQNQNLAGFPAGNGSGNGWEEAGGVGPKVVSESYLTGSSAVVNNASISLGAAYVVGGTHDLVFKYGSLAAGPNPNGDYNNNGVVDAADYVLWRNGGPLSNDSTPGVQPGDYDVWKANFGLTNVSVGPSQLVTGFVRYVTSGAGAVVPEPSGVLLVGMGLASLAVAGGRRRKKENN